MSKRIDMTGQRFGKWAVEAFDRTDGRFAYWQARCDCGAVAVIRGDSLRAGGSTMCQPCQMGALAEKVTTHGLSASLTWKSWHSMRMRCLSVGAADYRPDRPKRELRAWQLPMGDNARTGPQQTAHRLADERWRAAPSNGVGGTPWGPHRDLIQAPCCGMVRRKRDYAASGAPNSRSRVIMLTKARSVITPPCKVIGQTP